MKKSIIFALMLTIAAQGAWANEYYEPTRLGDGKCQYQGPWIFEDVGNACESYDVKDRSFNQLARDSWNPYANNWDADNVAKLTYQFNDDDGLGFKMHCYSSRMPSVYNVYSLYSHSENVPSYTRKRLTWNFVLKGYTDQHGQTVALYARPSMNDMKNSVVDATHDYHVKTGSQYLLARTTKTGDYQSGEEHSSALTTKTFDFDNRNGATTQSKTWVLLLTHCVRNRQSRFVDINQWGSFKDYGYSWETFYYKYITFDANGGEGTMENQTIENSGTLTANAFTRDNHTFAGWATEPNGEVVYADAAEITANEYSKGPVTLYAVWNRVKYFISYELNGGTATNPSSYTEATETFTLANPTRENSTFLGWVGSNGSTPEMTVTIAQGSTGDKTFIAHWECATSTTVIGLIDAIGEVEHTSESKAKIDAARAAYDALTAGEKADVPAPKLETLRIAEATYAANEQSTIRFMEQDGQTQVGEDQQRAIYYPSFPAGATKWQTTEKNASDKTIVIKAVE